MYRCDVVHCRRSKHHADDDDHAAGNDRGEETCNALGTEQLDQQRENQIQHTRCHDTPTDIRRKVLTAAVCGNGADGGNKRKTGAHKCGHNAFGNQVEDQSADAHAEQGNCGIETGQCRDKNRGAKHGKHMLDAERYGSAGLITAPEHVFQFHRKPP